MKRVTGTFLLLASLLAGCRGNERSPELAPQGTGVVAASVVRNGSMDRYLPERRISQSEARQPLPARIEPAARVPTAVIVDVQPEHPKTVASRPTSLSPLPAPEVFDTTASERLTLKSAATAPPVLSDKKPASYLPLRGTPEPRPESAEAKPPARLPALDIQADVQPVPPRELKSPPPKPQLPATLLEIARNGETVDASAAEPRLVNSRKINLDYIAKGASAAGGTDVDVWYTRDGKSWKKCPAAAPSPARRVVQVEGEGRHGFTLMAHGSDVPPRDGESPQVWVEVDETKPDVRLLKLVPITGAQSTTLAILWSATDPNLHPRPIRLSYAEQPQGPWNSIADGLENNGRYEWKLPSPPPARVMVRAEATDRAGNVGMDQMPEPVSLDPATPAVSIVDVSPAKATNPPVARPE